MVANPDVGGAEMGDNVGIAFKLVDTEGRAGEEETLFAKTSLMI